MISSMAEKLTNRFVANGQIKNEDRELYYYGLRQGFLMIVNIVTMLIIGLLFKMTWQAILFLGAYSPLRIYGGGFHAKTEFKCYLFSIGLTIIALLGIKFIPMTSFIIFSLIGVGGILIWCLAPVEDANKPLDEIENRVYRKRARIILIIETGIVLLAVLLNFKEIASVISIAILVLSIMLVLGMKKNKNAAIIKK